ncbi:MAG: SBBP repeat-containing protein [Candidatus Aminicenantes bacterium]|nr:SBBP repeat-containing protein [Candidatus Aminicenantes bacterium]
MKKRSLITILNLILLFSLVTFSHAEEYEFVTKWITQVDGHNLHPTGMTTDKEGFVYVAGQGKIAKYTSDGTFVLKIENIPNSDDFYFSSWQQHVAVDNSGNIYVTSWDDGIVVKFDSQGDYVLKWDSWSGGSELFNGPRGIAVDDSGNVYVCDYHNCRIVKFDSDGGYLATVASQGGNDGEVQNPADLAFDDSGNIYVADTGNNRIQVLDSSGTFIRKWGEWGTGDNHFKWIQGIAVDFNDNVYTADSTLLRVSKFSSDGTFILKWGGWGDDNYHFDYPHAIAVDYSGNLYVGDHNNNRVLKYKLIGTPTVEITNPAQDEFVEGIVSIEANVTVPDGYTISNVEFYRDDFKLDEVATEPYLFGWNTTSETQGAHTIWIVATNNEGAITKEKVSVFVANDDDPPSNSLTYPLDQDEIRGPVSIQASASDDKGIAKVEFYINGTLAGEATTTNPANGYYEYYWDTTTVNDGEKELEVIAYDTIGQFFSDTITVTVENQEEFGYITKWYTDNPTDVALDSAGNLYVAGSHKIKKYAPDGTYLSKIENTGNDDFNLDWNFYITIDNSGNIYASNQDNHNIVKFDSDGNYVTKWGSFGAAEDQFHSPFHIACDSTGNVYVCDYSNNRISKFTSNGTFITTWGTGGGGDGQFSNPQGIAVDDSDNIYVADRHNNRIQVFTSNGTFLRKWSSWGDGDNQFSCPNAIAFDSLGNVYITDSCYHRVTKFSSDDTFITKWGTQGSGDLQFYSPSGIAVDSNFYVYIADRNNNRVVKYKSTWLPTVEVTYPAHNDIITATDSIVIQVTASSEIGIDKVEFYINGGKVGEDIDNTDSTYEFNWNTSLETNGTYTIKAIAYNTQNTSLESEEISVIVNKDDLDEIPTVTITNPTEGDTIRLESNIQAEASDVVGINRVEFYVDGVKVGEDTDNTDSTYEYSWDATTVEDGERVIKAIAYDTIGQNVEESITVTVINHEEFGYVSKWSSNHPTDIEIDKNGNLYVAGGGQIKKYTPDGTLIFTIENNSSDYYLSHNMYVAIDDSGNIYVSNHDRNTVVKFDSDGNYVTKWGTFGTGNYEFYNPNGIAADSEGNVYICDWNNNRITKYDSDGTYLTEWGEPGGSDGQFSNPFGIAIDNSDIVYVTDYHNCRVQVFSADGTFIRKWGQRGYEDHQLRYPQGIALDSEGNVYVVDTGNYKVVKYTSDGTFLATWGKQGSGELQFECPNGIAVDSYFNVYVTDPCNSRITKFKSTWRPTVEITNPADNSVLANLTEPETIQANVSSAIDISKVEFYINGTLRGEDTTNPFEYAWDTSSETDGPYTLKAIAYNIQNITAESDEIYVVVKNNEDAPPTVSITNPSDGDTIRLTTRIQVEALDPAPGGIVKVEFYVDDTLVYEDTLHEWEYTWDATSVEDSERVIKVIAYDNIGQNVEDSITVTVINHEEFGYASKWSGDNPSDVAVDKDGYIYVAGNSKISKYTPDGTLVSKIEYTGNEEFYLDGWFHIAVDADGNIYATDDNSHNIIKFDSNGNYITQWGSYGQGDYQFYDPQGIATDSEGNVYVCDYSNNRIVKYDSEGTLLTEWGIQGGSDGEFNNPQGIAVDSSDNIYVTDQHNNRIQVFDSDGEFLRRWGSHGYEDTQFRGPRGITVDSEDNVYIVDRDNYRVVKYTSKGTFLAKWGTQGSGDLQFECMNGIAVDSDFNVYVTDNCNNRITIFKSSWRPTVEITNPADNSVLTSPVTIQATVESAIDTSKVEFYINGALAGETTTTNPANGYYEYYWDTTDGELDGPYTLKAIGYNMQNTSAESDEIYVVVKNNVDAPPTVSITNPAEGDIIRLTTNIQAEASDTDVIDRVEFYVAGIKVSEATAEPYEYTWDTTSVEDGEKVIKVVAYDSIGQNVEESITVTVVNHEEFGYITKWSHDSPTDVTVDKDGNLFIAGGHSISKYTPDGTLIFRIGQGADYDFSWWMHVAVDDSGNIYISNRDRNNVVKFDSNGNYVTKWGNYGGGNDQFNNPFGIAVDSLGNVYIVDQENHRISKFNSDGTFLATWGTAGGSDGQLQSPMGIAVDSADNIFVTDNNHRVNVFDSEGEFLRKWGNYGYEDTQFRWPNGIAVDSKDNVYVSDTGNYRVMKYTSDGTFITKWGTQGSEDFQFECPNSIAVDSNFNVYVTDNCNNRVTKFKSTWLPTIEITNPADNSIITTDSVTIQAAVECAIGISKVEFYINDAIAGEDTTNPYEYYWDTLLETDGPYTIKAIVYNIQNITTESDEISVVVNRNNDTAPTVSITSPQDGDIIRKDVDIEADANDDINIDKVEFYIADTLVSTDTETPYLYSWDTTTVGDGETEIKVIAYDTIGQNTSDSIFVTVANQEAYEYISTWDTWNYGHPRSITIDKYGRLFVTFHERIVKLTSTGSFLSEITNEGTNNNYQLTGEMCIAVDDSGNLYVSNRYTHEIIKFDSNGNYVTKWGSQGDADDQFNEPEGIAVDSNGNIFICDAGNHRIVSYTSNGEYRGRYGSQGNADGYFQWPVDIAIDSDGNMYIAENWNNRIQVLDSSGTFVRKFGNWGYGDGEFQCIRGITLDSEKNVYVADECNHKITKFSSGGEFITKWGSFGTGENQLQNPRDVAVDSSGNVYVADQSNQRIMIFRVIGTPTVEITSPAENSSVSGSVWIAVTAESEFGINKVEFYIDDELKATRTEAPYIYDWDTSSYPNGSHEIKAVAYNSDLKSAETSISIIVSNGGDLAPEVSITNIKDGAVIRGTVLIKADASDDVSVEQVEFYVDETLLVTFTEYPYEYSWDTTTTIDSQKELKAVAYDTIGQSTWTTITVIVDNANNIFSANLSEAAVVYIDMDNKLRKIDLDGNVSPVINADPYVAQFQFDPEGNLFIFFWHPQELRDGYSYILVKINPDANEVIGIDKTLSHMEWNEQTASPNIQFDGLGSTYYLARDDSWNLVLRKYTSDANIEDLINENMRIDHWLVRQNGTVVMGGETESTNLRWLRRLDPDHSLLNIAEPSEIGWIAEFPDNRVYAGMRFSDWHHGVYKLPLGLLHMDEQAEKQPYIGHSYGDYTPQYDIEVLIQGHTDEYCRGFTQWQGGAMLYCKKDSSNNVYGLMASWWDVYRTVVKLFPVPEIIEPQVVLLDRPTLMNVAGNYLVIAGSKDGINKLVLYNTLTREETNLLTQDIEIYHLDVLSNGNIIFDGLRFEDNTTVVCMLEQAVSTSSERIRALGYGFKELAELGGKPLSFGVFENVSGSDAVSVQITSVLNNATVNGTVSIKTAGASPSAISMIEFYIDGELKATDVVSPFTFNWDTTEYSEGTHTVKVKMYDASAQTAVQEITVNVNNSTSPGEIKLSTTQIYFAASANSNPTGSQKFVVENTGGLTLEWSAGPSEDWMQVSPSSGTGSSVVTVSIVPSGLSVGTYTGTISIEDPAATNSPQAVTVTLKIYSAVSVQKPFGSFESPIDGTTGIRGAVPLSGWVLDDIEVDRVELWREPVGGETTASNGLVYIGNAILIEGARPDVVSMYPNYPLNYQAGWGYMLLTNYLPDENGTYTIYAVAYDKDGYSEDLGAKTITCDNSGAYKPFGTIDTPTQGGEASGDAFINFGWALTPQPNYIPDDGSTVTVWINGINIGNAVYNQYRSDVANLFSGYSNSDGAVGYFFINTTEYANGVHTIAWHVEDSAGNSDFIGTRYFTIVNVDNTGTSLAEPGIQRVGLNTPLPLESTQSLPISFEALKVTRGCDKNTEAGIAEADSYGIFHIEMREVERVKVDFGEAADYTGYLIVGDKLRPLPVGSTLNSENGTFVWQPGPGFIGEYNLVFIKKDENGVQRKIKTRIKILPKFSIF